MGIEPLSVRSPGTALPGISERKATDSANIVDEMKIIANVTDKNLLGSTENTLTSIPLPKPPSRLRWNRAMSYLEVALVAADFSRLEPRLGKALRGGKKKGVCVISSVHLPRTIAMASSTLTAGWTS